MPFIRKRKLRTLNNEILRLTRVNEAWELQNKSDLDELRKVQEQNKKLRSDITSVLLKHEELVRDYTEQSKKLDQAAQDNNILRRKNEDLARALHRASHSTHKGGHHGN